MMKATATTIALVLVLGHAVSAKAQSKPAPVEDGTGEVMYKLSSATVGAENQAQLVSPAPNPLGGRELNTTAAAQSRCELRMLIEQQPGGGTDMFGLYEIGANKIGAMVVERVDADGDPSTDDKTLASGICLKHAGEAVALPAAILIAASSSGVGRFCQGDADEGFTLMSSRKDTPPVTVSACTWNGIFHSSRPFTITLLTDRTAKVSDFVEYLRIFRNGDLMAAYNRSSDSIDPWRVIVRGKALTTGAFAATHPPHLSAMDIRLIPRENGLSHTVDLQTRNDRQRFEARLLDASQAALDSAVPPGSDVRKSLDCLRQALKQASSQILKVANGEISVPKLDDACHPLIDAGGATPLSTAYSDLKNQNAEKLDELRATAAQTITTLQQQLVNAIPSQERPLVKTLLETALRAARQNLPATLVTAGAAIDKCVEELSDPGRAQDCLKNAAAIDPSIQREYEKFASTAAILDRDVSAALQTADEAHLLVEHLSDDAKQIVASPAKQAQIFAAFTKSLEDDGSPFEPRRSNPTLVAGELKIDMAYADRLQVFVLAPWNGVPIRFNASTGADFNAGVTVPLLDLLGLRFQWSRSRFADMRAAVGLGYTDTKTLQGDETRSAVLTHASLGFGTLKVGFGLVLGGTGLGSTKDRMRLIVGIDLYKLITGSNVELL